jgi:DNA-binding beta-propeller fold protein YncE
MSDENKSSILSYRRTDNSENRQGEPLRQIIGDHTSLEFVCGITVDPRNREVFAVNNDVADNMVVFGPDQNGDSPPSRELKVDHGAWGVAVDLDNEEVAVTTEHINKVSLYRRTATGKELPLRIIQGPRTGIADPHGAFIDPKNNEIYVANIGAWHLVRTGEQEINGVPDWWKGYELSGKVQAPSTEISLLPSTGRYFLPSITIYPRLANGDAVPSRTIQGPKTQLSGPLGIYVDPEHSEFAVANDGGDSVLIFSTKANGDVAPLRVLKGPATGIKFPSGVWIDTKNDEIWVANWGNHSATVYPRTAQGNVKPKRTIRSAPEGTPLNGMGNPSAMVYDEQRDELLVPN